MVVTCSYGKFHTCPYELGIESHFGNYYAHVSLYKPQQLTYFTMKNMKRIENNYRFSPIPIRPIFVLSFAIGAWKEQIDSATTR